ncbi:MAG: hypothetical protein JWM32_1051 [Verrucomicrobia bacterium]|nr:hypothetical protein [Verrucomicrobiota bacterium]
MSENISPRTLNPEVNQGNLAADNRVALQWASACFLGFTVYATARYNVFKGVPWADWPIYTLNKVFGLSCLALLVVAAALYRFGNRVFNPRLVYLAGLCGIIHSVLSLFLLGPAYYPSLHLGGKLTVSAGLSMLVGTIGIVTFALGGKNAGTKAPARRVRGLALFALAFGIHAGLLGYESWAHPEQWPGGLPPLTVISLAMGAAAMAMTFTHRGRKSV